MSFLFDWFWGMLSYLGLSTKNAKILFLGLDNAGKTTLLNKLKHGKISAHQPTTHPGFEEIQLGGVNFKAHDLGGHETARKLWSTYFPQVDAIVYLVDAVDKERFPEAKKELDSLLSTEGLTTTPIVILGNKIDVPRAASEAELRSALGLMDTTGKDVTSIPKDSGVRPIEIFMCSIVRETGYADAFRWVSNFL